MADYWKSQPKKFCDFCKCWISDNKPSVQYHENGKRHKENVQQRISQIQKKGMADLKKKTKQDDDIRKMELAALAAYKKDIGDNPDYTATVLSEKYDIKGVSNCPENEEVGNPVVNEKVFQWYEAVSDSGHPYYWNTETGESAWTAPDEGFVSLEEQKKQTEEESKNPAKKESTEDDIIPSSFGPQLKPTPFGSWSTLKVEDSKPTDLQLPTTVHHYQATVPVNVEDIPVPSNFSEKTYKSEETEIKAVSRFSEKVYKSETLDSVVKSEDAPKFNFKKRKTEGSRSRNSRQRTDDL